MKHRGGSQIAVSNQQLADSSQQRGLLLIIVESENKFTLRGRIPYYTFVGAGLPSPYDPARVCK